MEKCIIVAIADNNAIGKDNDLLWHISEDLKFFKRTTMGCPVIMGRRTFESIGRPLPKRLNIVVSRNGYAAPEGVRVVASLDEAYSMAEEEILRTAQNDSNGVISAPSLVMSSEDETSMQRAFVIGGGQIYAQALEMADRLIVTHVHTVIPEADTFFPAIDPAVWQVADRSGMHHDEESGFDFEFVEYKRK